MPERLSYKDAPDKLRELIDRLRRKGSYLVIENDQNQPVACVMPLPTSDRVRQEEAMQKLRELLERVPPSPYSEEDTYRIIDEAIATVRQDRRDQTVG